MGRRIRGLIRKEFAQIFRDGPLVFMLIWAFTAAVYSAGRGRAMETSEIATAVYDLSRGPASREFLSRLQRPYFKTVAYLEHEADIASWLDRGKAVIVIVIPPGFQRDIDGGRQAHLQVLTDGSLAMSATVAVAYIATISARYSVDVLDRLGRVSGARRAPSLDERLRVKFNPNMLSAWFAGLLELLNMTTIIALLLTTSTLVKEKERGTVEQLLVSPVRPIEICLGKIVPAIVIVVVLSACSFGVVLMPVFHLPFRGSWLLFYGVTVLYVIAMTSMGIAIAVVARTLPQAIMIMILFLQPMIFLSGAWNPPEAMMPWMRALSLASPLRYYIDFAFGVVLKGNGLNMLLGDIAGIAVLGVALLTFSLLWFERRIRAQN